MPVCFCLWGNAWKIKIQTVWQVVSLRREGLMLNEVWIHKCLESPRRATSSELPSPSPRPASQFIDTSCSSPSSLLGHALLPIHSVVPFSSLLLPSPPYLFQKKDPYFTVPISFFRRKRDSSSEWRMLILPPSRTWRGTQQFSEELLSLCQTFCGWQPTLGLCLLPSLGVHRAGNKEISNS